MMARRPRPARAEQGFAEPYWHEKLGRFKVDVSLGSDPKTGKRRRKSVYGGTVREARRAARALQTAYESGELGLRDSAAPVTVEHLLRDWLTSAMKMQPSTYAKAEWAVKQWLIPNLGHLRIEGLEPGVVEIHLGAMTGIKGNPATKATRDEVLGILRRAINWGLARDLIVKDFTRTIVAKIHDETRPKVMSRDEVARALFFAERSEKGAARLLLGITLGLRQSELLGLQWSDIDLDEGTVSITKQWVRSAWMHGCKNRGECATMASRCPQRQEQPKLKHKGKTSAARRELAMDERVIEALRGHRRKQLEQRVASGGNWNPDEWVFVNTAGTNPIDHRRDDAQLKKLCRDAGLPDFHIHALRHTSASLSLLGGVDPRVVQDLFGWTSARMLSRYQHVVDESKRKAANAIADQVFGQVIPFERKGQVESS